MVALAQFDSLTKENFKCLIYISALQGTKYADIRTRLLSKLEKQEGCTLADLVNESESIIGLKKDSDIVDDTTYYAVNAVQRGNQRKKNRQDLSSKENPRASTKGAFLCGSLIHLKKDCPQNECHNKRGPTRQPRIKKIEGDLKANRRYTEDSFGETMVRMQVDSGVDVTAINREAWEQIGSTTLEKMTTSLGAANGTLIEVLGQFDVHLRRTFRSWSLLCGWKYWTAAGHLVDELTSTSSEGLQCYLLQDWAEARGRRFWLEGFCDILDSRLTQNLKQRNLITS